MIYVRHRMLCSVSCTLVLEEWTNSPWINKGIFIFFLDLNCLTCFLLECQWVLNNSCRQSLILPSPSALLWAGDTSFRYYQIVAIGCALELPKLKPGSWPALWNVTHESSLQSTIGTSTFWLGHAAEGQRACGELCAGDKDRFSHLTSSPVQRQRWKFERRTRDTDFSGTQIATSASRTLSWCWINICGIKQYVVRSHKV